MGRYAGPLREVHRHATVADAKIKEASDAIARLCPFLAGLKGRSI
jgi:hypothetical protein